MQKFLFLLPAILLTAHVTTAQIANYGMIPRVTGVAHDISNYEGDGFKAEYYNGSNFEQKVLTRVEKKIDFFLISKSPLPGVDADYFSVRWTGKLYAPRTGTYNLIFIADDAVRLWLNGKLLINEWRLNRATAFYGKIHLTGNQAYDLKIEYSQMKPSAAVARVLWSFEDEPEKPIDPKYIFSSPKKIVPPVAAKKPAPPVKKEPAPTTKAPTEKPAITTEVAQKKTPAPEDKQPVAKVNTPAQKKQPVAKPTEKPKTPPPADDTDADVPETTFENLEANKAVVLNHIIFDQSKFDLRPESFEELNKLANTLHKYPAMKILIVGHTDNVGDFNLNVQLSKNRAKAVADYLINKGIAADRLEFKGFGGMYPVAPNSTEENKVKNRRVEFVVK